MKTAFILLLLPAYFLVCDASGKHCRSLPFFLPKEGHALTGHVIDTLENADLDQCYMYCYLNDKCVSINQGKMSDGTQICELNSSDDVRDPGDLVPRDNFVYCSTKNGCSRSPCVSNATCIPGDSPDQHRCVCPSGYEGHYCQRAIAAEEHRFGDITFQVFLERKTWDQARVTCASQGALLAPIADEAQYKFISTTVLASLPTESLPPHLRDTLKHFRLNGSDSDVRLHGAAAYESIRGTAVLSLPGIAGSYADTPPIDFGAKSLTIALWVKLSSASACFFYSDFVGATPSFAVGVKATMELIFGLKNTFAQDLAHLPPSGSTIPILSVNKGVHVAVTFDHATGQSAIFQNGVKVTSMTTSVTNRDIRVNHNNNCTLGLWGVHWFHGQMSQILVYGRALSEQDITAVKDGTSIRNAKRAWVGISDVVTEGRYQSTLPGTPDATYLEWSSIQPLLSQNNKDCVAVGNWEGGGMEETKCEKKLPFVCMRKLINV